MCDTLIATRAATTNQTAIFGKNSDRPPNEAQHLQYVPAQIHPAQSKVKCTYIEIPQSAKTHAVLLSKPYWMWGAEMGVNEHGVVIGNEAVFSKIPANKTPALLGMDLLRLGLERAATARDALRVIIDLLETFGQGGNCLAEGSLYYHNSFIIADADDAWTLETVDKQWAARQVKTTHSISNCLTLGAEYDLASADLVNLALQKRLTQSPATFDYRKDYSDFIYTTFSKGRPRQASTTRALNEQKISLPAMLKILRSHDHAADPQTGLFNVGVCMHAGIGPLRGNQSVGSLAAYLQGTKTLVLVTGTSAPCTSIFKPVWLDAPLPDFGAKPARAYDSASLFWSHEKLHRATLLNYPERLTAYAAERDALEEKFIKGALNLQDAPAAERGVFSASCFYEAAQAEARWLARVLQIPARAHPLHRLAWRGFNRKANMPIVE